MTDKDLDDARRALKRAECANACEVAQVLARIAEVYVKIDNARRVPGI